MTAALQVALHVFEAGIIALTYSAIWMPCMLLAMYCYHHEDRVPRWITRLLEFGWFGGFFTMIAACMVLLVTMITLMLWPS